MLAWLSLGIPVYETIGMLLQMKLRLGDSGLGHKDGEKLFLLLYEKRSLNQLVLAVIIGVNITCFQIKLLYFLISQFRPYPKFHT